MNAIEDYAKGGLSYVGGSFTAAFVDALVMPYFATLLGKILFQKAPPSVDIRTAEMDATSLILAMLEVAIFMLIIGAVGGKMDAMNQLFFVIGIFGTSPTFAQKTGEKMASQLYAAV